MVGEFKDDCLQDHLHYSSIDFPNGDLMIWNNPNGNYAYSGAGNQFSLSNKGGGIYNSRSTTVTHGKQKGVKYIIKVL